MIKRILFIGAGAIAGYLISGLLIKQGLEIYAAAEGERKERLKKDGIIVNGERMDIGIVSPDEMKDPDLIMVCVKYNALREVLPYIEKMAGAGTLIMLPLNGVDSEEIAAEALGKDRIVPSFMKVSSRRIGNDIRFDREKAGGLYFGEEDGIRTERIMLLEELFSGTGVRYHSVPDITVEMWKKFASNIARNLPQAVLDLGVGAYYKSEHLKYISKRLKEEVRLVAKARGIDIYEDDSWDTVNTIPDDTRFSTLQDIDAGRHTEIEMFSGVLIRYAKEAGIEVPFNEYTYHAIKCLEEKNDGIIS